MILESNYSLQSHNTFGIDVKARYFCEVHTEGELIDLLSSDIYRQHISMMIGGGSNVLLTQDYDGLIIKNSIKGISCRDAKDDKVLIRAMAGEVWHEFVLHCIEQGWGGLENMSLIPGCVGAAPMQNIGAYGVELKDSFLRLRAIHRESGEIQTFEAHDCAFGYRTSVFKTQLKDQYFILSIDVVLRKNATLNLSYGAIKNTLKEQIGDAEPTIKDVSNAVIAIRQSKLPDPAELGNAGSFFKNPYISKHQYSQLLAQFPDMPSYPVDEALVKVPAGWLIEQAGWKGKVVGQTGAHKNQALVLVNYGNATGAEVYALSEAIMQSVKERYGIQLEREVNVI